MFAGALGQGRLGWVLGLSLLALASYALKAVMGFGVGSTLQVGGSPGGMVALLLGLLLDGVLWLLGIKVAVEALMRALAGPADSVHREEIVADGLALRHLVLWAALLVAGWLLWHVLGARAALLAALAFACVAPAVLSLLTLEGSLLRAFDPRAWLEMLRRAGPAYAAGAVQVAGLLLAGALLAAALGALLPGWLAAAPVRFVQLASLVLAYHALGEWLHRMKGAFELATPAPLPRARLASFDEDAAMQEADALAAADPPDPAAAAARLLPVLRGRGGSAPVHARYRELLQAAGDRDALLAHDREYVATLLALGQDRQALALFLSARTLEPGFELQEPEELGRLAELTERLGQARLSGTLALEYAQRFPRTRGALAQGLRAVRLLAAEPGRGPGLRALLEDLLPRHPEHALHAEAEQALRHLPRA